VGPTPKQQQAYDLRHSTTPLMRFVDVAKAMGVPLGSAKSSYYMCKMKLDNPISNPEDRDPEKTAAMIDLATNPAIRSVQAACKDAGLPYDTTRNLVKRLDRDLQPVARELKRVKTDSLVREFENVGLAALQSITQEDLEKASAYQRILIAAISIDKRELLDGRPTERMSVEDRRQIPELMTALLVEAERRGLTRQVNPETGKVYLVDREDAPQQVRAGRERMAAIDVEVVP